MANTAYKPTTLGVTREHKILIALTVNCLLILSLLGGFTYALNWSLLAICTLLFFISYPLVWLCWKGWQLCNRPITQLISYVATLAEEPEMIQLQSKNENDLTTALQRQIEKLVRTTKDEHDSALSIEHLLSQVMQAWSQPICLFNNQLTLLYANPACFPIIKKPMLRGTPAKSLGFSWQEGVLAHGAFNSDWQCQSTQYQQKDTTFIIFSAAYIADIVSEAEIDSQKNLVRVLSHELRNSLTPIASMSDTLLSAPKVEHDKVRIVLERIHRRSNRLLDFVQRYAQLYHLPKPQPGWFEFNPVLDETITLLACPDRVSFRGERRCYGDQVQLTQLLINLLKNALEALPEGTAEIAISFYTRDKQQVLSIQDNGDGFANLDNLFVPFYTTKSKGSGIGLALCAAIARNHGGELTANNREQGGAIVQMCLP